MRGAFQLNDPRAIRDMRYRQFRAWLPGGPSAQLISFLRRIAHQGHEYRLLKT